MARRSRLYWLGAKIQERVQKAAMRAVDRTTGAAAEHIRNNHPGWKTQTGTAARSIGTNPARLQARRIRGNVTGGEGEAWYLTSILEVKHGSAIRTGADVVFPTLQDTLHDEYRKAGD